VGAAAAGRKYQREPSSVCWSLSSTYTELCLSYGKVAQLANNCLGTYRDIFKQSQTRGLKNTPKIRNRDYRVPLRKTTAVIPLSYI
jgi:hypothetical protein